MWKLPFQGPSVFRNSYIVTLRSSRSHMFFKMGVLKNFAKFTRKRLPPESPFLIKLQVWGLQLFEKKKLWHRYFSVNFSKHLFYRPPAVATSVLCFNILLKTYALHCYLRSTSPQKYFWWTWYLRKSCNWYEHMLTTNFKLDLQVKIKNHFRSFWIVSWF